MSDSDNLLLRRDVDFLLFEWLKVDRLTQFPRFADHDRNTFDAVIDLAARLAIDKFYPINRLLDTEEPCLQGDEVITPAALKPAVEAFRDSGLIAAGIPAEAGGLQLPSVIERVCGAYMTAASAGGATFGLTPPNVGTLLKYGDAFQRDVLVPPMVEGRWFGTMCLSEPQAGSSLSDITTRALPQEDGSYRLFGNKMWISGGDHDLAENIVHLVLAKIPDESGTLAPGTRSISLFAVPKFLVGTDGEMGPRNDIAVAGLNHKLGYRGIPNCLLNFGEGRYLVEAQVGAVGSIVGEAGRGLACMFHMMNDARIMIGNGAAAIGYVAYRHALAYARERRQGRKPQDKSAGARQLAIIEHADVRRMLLAQKAYAEGALALTLYCARLLDVEVATTDPQERDEASLLLDLLTPVAKSWPSQWCLEGCSLAIQVHGGYGYTRDFMVEQYWRDQRLNAIHEGTHGIQGIDLLGRKLRLHGGRAWQLLRHRLAETARTAAQAPSLAGHGAALSSYADRVETTIERLLATGDLNLTLANSSAFLEVFGHLVVGWIWLQQADTADLALSEAESADADFYRGKLQAAHWYFRWELPRIGAWLDALDALDTSAADMRDEWF